MTRSILLMLLVGLAFAQGHAASPDAGYANSTASCLACHGADRFHPAEDVMDTVHGKSGNPASPFADGNRGCESCHGPSAVHMTIDADGVRPPPGISFGKQRDAQQQDQACLDCHKSETPHWSGSAHAFEGVTCSGCHTIHTDHPAGAQQEQNTCLECHREIRADLERESVHPTTKGEVACTDCHNPHGGRGPALLEVSTVNDNCYACHTELRGPFLFEHAPVRESCMNCHVPHGSNHEPLLQGRTPWMCQQCHLAQFHPSTLLDGNQRPPRGASQSMLGKDCMNCHSKIHGSNHPSGSGLVR